MGQAWCKEKSSKAQDSKSPLDRVFVRCAHRIYPGLKEEGSVLGGATQRVTSSEIGYAGSPPRAALLRGQSIDSVDRPFHPSEWVDVNLEVPCTPRASVILTGVNLATGRQLTANDSSRSKDSKKPLKDALSTTTPVPPPRRRRRRERRPLPPKPNDVGADDESELKPEPLYSKVVSPRSVNAYSTTTLDDDDDDEDEVDGSKDSDEEFIAIERTLEKGSLEDAGVRPKNHSTTSLPNFAKLTTPTTDHEEAAATRPPRHQAKTASLPRDASLFPPQTPERIFFASTTRTVEEDSVGDNSIFKKDASADERSPDCSLRFETDVKTSTPVKATSDAGQWEDPDDVTSSRSSQQLDDVFESFQNESSKSHDSSSRQQEVEEEEVDRPAGVEEQPRRNEDAGYESRSSGSHLFPDGSNDESGRTRTPELSSGILRDATPDSSASERPDNPAAVLQRTISEESLPREMLVDELEEEEELAEGLKVDKSVKDAEKSNHLARQTSEQENFGTPPPSPEPKVLVSSSDSVDGPVTTNHSSSIEKDREEDPKAKKPESNGTDEANLSSMTPSLMELEAALTSMLEKKDEREREESGERPWEPSPEPQIIPVKHNRADTAGKSRAIDLPRTNPFNDLKSDDSDLTSSAEEAPEKPSRLYRISLIEESPLSEPLIIPTPPRRRHRSKSNLNLSSTPSPVPLHIYGTSNDRLI